MHLKNLLKPGCFIALCSFALSTSAQNLTINGKGANSNDTVTTKNFNHGAIFNPVDQLSGKVAGLSVTQPGGDPNQVASMSIRGQASVMGNLSPLFVVDGVMLDNAAQFQSIPPDEIVSYEIIKDASAAAIYGSRGVNGVIIVTTKRGSAGKPVISYDGLIGTASQSKFLDLLTPGQYRQTVSSLYPSALSVVDKGANTDWQKAITGTAIQQKNSLSLSGGGNTFNYLGGIDYQNQQGIIQNNGKEQLGLRFNGEVKALADKLDLKAGIQYVNTTRKFTDYTIFGYVPNVPPTYPIKNPDGSYYAFTDFNEVNPVEHVNGELLGDKEHLTLINGSIDYSITHDLKFGIFGSADINKIGSDGYIPSFPIEGNQSQESRSDESSNSYDANVHLNYDKVFGKSTLNLLGAYEYNKHSYNLTYANGIANNSNFGTNGTLSEGYKLMSFIARAAYSYDDRFYATIIVRDDSRSNFGANASEVFPSISAAYRFKKDLFADVDWISDFKLRAGYGITGNSTDQGGNPEPGWEKVYGTNIGLDFSLFKGRVSGYLNYFNDETKNLLLLYSVPSPPFVTNTLLANGGNMTNKGLEVALSGQIITGHKLSWAAYGQITFLTTTLTNLSGQYTYNGQNYPLTASQVPVGYAQGRGLSTNPIVFNKTGYSPYVFYLPHFTGVDAQGNQTFNGQTIPQNPNPAGYYIDPAPKFNYGITNSFDYGNWNLTFALRGVYGQKVFDNNRLNIETITRLPGNNVTKEALTNGIKDAPVASDLWLEGASFLRLDNATLGYSFKNLSFAKVLRVYVGANNLFVITSYKGQDPEVRTQAGYSNQYALFGANVNGSQNQPYIDNNYGGQGYYPMAREFSLGLNVTLK